MQVFGASVALASAGDGRKPLLALLDDYPLQEVGAAFVPWFRRHAASLPELTAKVVEIGQEALGLDSPPTPPPPTHQSSQNQLTQSASMDTSSADDNPPPAEPLSLPSLTSQPVTEPPAAGLASDTGSAAGAAVTPVLPPAPMDTSPERRATLPSSTSECIICKCETEDLIPLRCCQQKMKEPENDPPKATVACMKRWAAEKPTCPQGHPWNAAQMAKLHIVPVLVPVPVPAEVAGDRELAAELEARDQHNPAAESSDDDQPPATVPCNYCGVEGGWRDALCVKCRPRIQDDQRLARRLRRRPQVADAQPARRGAAAGAGSGSGSVSSVSDVPAARPASSTAACAATSTPLDVVGSGNDSSGRGQGRGASAPALGASPPVAPSGLSITAVFTAASAGSFTPFTQLEGWPRDAGSSASGSSSTSSPPLAAVAAAAAAAIMQIRGSTHGAASVGESDSSSECSSGSGSVSGSAAVLEASSPAAAPPRASAAAVAAALTRIHGSTRVAGSGSGSSDTSGVFAAPASPSAAPPSGSAAAVATRDLGDAGAGRSGNGSGSGSGSINATFPLSLAAPSVPAASSTAPQSRSSPSSRSQRQKHVSVPTGPTDQERAALLAWELQEDLAPKPSRQPSSKDEKRAPAATKLESKRNKALKLFCDRDKKTVKLPDPFADGVQLRFRSLRPLLGDAPVEHAAAFVDVCVDVYGDSKACEAVHRYALGRLVSEAATDVAIAAALEVVRGDDAKKWSKDKQKALRFFELCRDFPAALGIRGVFSFCQQADWTKVLRQCFEQEEKKAQDAGAPRPLGAWPAWARS